MLFLLYHSCGGVNTVHFPPIAWDGNSSHEFSSLLMLRLRLALKAVLIPSSSLYLSPSVTQHYFPARNPDLFPLRDLIQTGCQRRLASISPGLDWVRRVSTSCRWRRSPGQIKTCINKLQFCSADSVINRSPRTVTSVPGSLLGR